MNQIQLQKIKNTDFIKGYEEGMKEGDKQRKEKDLQEIKKMTKFLWRDDIVKFLEEL